MDEVKQDTNTPHLNGRESRDFSQDSGIWSLHNSQDDCGLTPSPMDTFSDNPLETVLDNEDSLGAHFVQRRLHTEEQIQPKGLGKMKIPLLLCLRGQVWIGTI